MRNADLIRAALGESDAVQAEQVAIGGLVLRREKRMHGCEVRIEFHRN
jgi:hypothetical protein